MLDGDYVDFSLQSGLNGAALDAVIRACQRRGWLDGRGALTDSGRARLVFDETKRMTIGENS